MNPIQSDYTPSLNNNGRVEFWKPQDLTPAEQKQARENIGVYGQVDVSALEQKIDEFQGDVNEMSATVTAVSSQFDTVTANVNDALTAATAALAGVDTVTANVAEISGKVDTNSADIGTISANLAGVSGSVYNDLSGKVNQNTNRINQVSAKADQNIFNINNISTNVNTNSANIASLSGKVNTISANLNTVSGNLNNVSASANSAVAIANSAQSIAVNADGKVNSISGAVDSAISSFSATVDSAVSSCIEDAASAASAVISAKQDKLSAGQNISISTAGVIDVNHTGGALIGTIPGVILGYNCSASNYSFAGGSQTLASGIQSFSIGANTRALGQASHAEGNFTYTSGAISHAEGRNTSAINYGSHAEGSYTISDTDYQHVEGQYNAPATGALHVIGNGSATTARSNIVETYSDRVVVNGDLINDTKDATMTQFMFDQYVYPTTSTNYGKLLTSGCKVAANYVYNVQQYTLGNYTMNVVSGITGAGQPVVTNPSGVIVDWYGNVGTVMQGRYESQWKPVAWPTDKLPRNIYHTSSQVSFVDFSKWNLALTELPSGWYNSFTAYCSEPGSYLYHCRGMFYHCINLTGDVKPWMDFVLSQSATGQAGASDRAYYRAGMFGDCSGIDNYATLTADPTYSAFFTAV